MKMKRTALALFSALSIAFLASSCGKDVLIPTTETTSDVVTVKFNDWLLDNNGTNDYYYALVDWNAVTQQVVENGKVDVFLYEGNRQSPLPYVYPIPVTYPNGTTGFEGENLRFDVEVGRITLILEDLDGGRPPVSRSSTPDMTFRIVLTQPATYVLEQ